MRASASPGPDFERASGAFFVTRRSVTSGPWGPWPSWLGAPRLTLRAAIGCADSVPPSLRSTSVGWWRQPCMAAKSSPSNDEGRLSAAFCFVLW